MYDARIGRWVSPDPYGQFSSGYVGMGNNPVNGTDPDGGIWIPDFSFLRSDVFWTALSKATSNLLDDVVVVGAKEVTKSAATRATGAVAAGAARVAYAKTILGDKTYSMESTKPWKETNVRGRSAEFKFDDKQTDCVETQMDVLRKTDPEIYKSLTDDYGKGPGGNVGTVKLKIEKKGGKFRKTDPKEGDLMIWYEVKKNAEGKSYEAGHIEMVVSVKAGKVHGETFIEVYGSGSKNLPVPRITGKDWLKVGGESGIKPGTKFIGYWTPF